MRSPTRPATPWVNDEAHSGTIGVVVVLKLLLEVLLVFDFEPPIFKLI
ncbi:MAG: hypothetical protein ABI655_15970 [Phenylobacterium sp.]